MMGWVIRLAGAIAAIAIGCSQAMAQAPVRGGTLTMTVNPEPTTLVSAVTSASPTGAVSTKILEGLVNFDLDVNVQPSLAESWKVSPDGKEVRFNLRKGVKWHDGKPFTSADVAFSIMKVLRELHPHGRVVFDAVTAVETPDDNTAIFRLSAPSPAMFVALSGYEGQIVPKHLYEGTDIAKNPANSAPIGTGPFKFKEWKRGDYIILERNENYWDQPKPYLDRIIVRFIPDVAARAAALESGDLLYAANNPVALTDVERLRGLPQLAIETRGYEFISPQFMMELNTERPYLKEKRVRQALMHAIDKNWLIQNIWLGLGKPATGPIPSHLTKFYSANMPKYDFDPKKAEQLLDEAGFKRGSDGKRFKLTHDPLPYGPEFVRAAEYVRQALGKVGIDVEIRTQDVGAYVTRIYTNYDYDMTNTYLFLLPDPTLGIQRLYWSKNIKKGVAYSNGTHYAVPEMDDVLEKAAAEPDQAKRAKLFERMQQMVQEDLPVLNLVEMQLFTVVNKKVVNHTTQADGVYASFADVYLKP